MKPTPGSCSRGFSLRGGPGVGVATTRASPTRPFPFALYGAIHVIEGETVTPMLLARRFTLNPVLVVFSFVFWFWLGRPWRDPVSANFGHDQNRL